MGLRGRPSAAGTLVCMAVVAAMAMVCEGAHLDAVYDRADAGVIDTARAAVATGSLEEARFGAGLLDLLGAQHSVACSELVARARAAAGLEAVFHAMSAAASSGCKAELTAA